MHQRLFRGRKRRGPFVQRMQGFTLMEVMIALVVIPLMVVGVIEGLLQSQRFATKSRLMTNARIIVQRNIEAATGIAFTGTTNLLSPASFGIVTLGTTGTSGSVSDDDAGSPTENISAVSYTHLTLPTNREV